MSGAPLTCEELVELITDYLEGAMPADERLAFERHIAICTPCRGYLAQMRATLRAAGRLSAAAIDPEAERVLVAHFREWRRGRAGP